MSEEKWLRSHVERLLQDVWDVCRVRTDSDGDYPFRFGTASGYVRVEPGKPHMVRVFAFATVDTPRTAKLLTELNDINASCRTASVFWSGGAVIVQQAVLATALKRSTLRQAFEAVGSVADDIGSTISAVFGGRTPFEPGETEVSREAG